VRQLYLRWKIADNLHGRWEVYRHDEQQPWYVGAADTLCAAREILDYDRCYWLLQRHARESRGPQTYAEPGIWT
jgi:hypothetical protein